MTPRLRLRQLALCGACGCLMGMMPEAPATIGYEDLDSLTAAGTCTRRPSAAGAPFYSAMASASSSVNVLHHAANRLGFGFSPFGPLTTRGANDCTRVFLAEDIARQISAIGSNVDHPLLQTVRAGAAPFTMYPRSDINAAIIRFQASAPGSTAAGDMWWESWHNAANLSMLRELVGSQTVTATGTIIDHQVNLEALFSEFWFNHLNISTGKATQYAYGKDGYVETLKVQIGSTFFNVLRAALRHPAMIVYLDNQANFYDSSTDSAGNQNLARELLELHTFGLGPRTSPTDTASIYGQPEIEAMAKVLAGWNAVSYKTAVASGASGFVFNSALAANIPVAFIGVSYPATGEARVEAVLKWLSNHAQTKKFICTKLSSLLYADSLVAAARDACVAAWGVDGNLRSIYKALLARGEFWSSANYRTLYRTPIELVVSALRAEGVNLVDFEYVVRTLGMTEARFRPATLTDADAFATDILAFRELAPRSFLQQAGYRIEHLMGVPRTSFAAPTGYSQDGADYFSTAYIDDVSRLAHELAGLLSLFNPSRNDKTSRTIAQAVVVNDPDRLQSPVGPMWRYVVETLGLGTVVGAPASATPLAPYRLPASQQAALGQIATTPTFWAYWTVTPGGQLFEKTWPASVLGNAAQLRK